MVTLDIIFRLLKEQHKTQKDLCEYLGVNKQAFTNWKNGHTTSYKKYLPQIAEFFDVSVDYLTGRTEKAAQEGLPLSAKDKEILEQLSYLTEDDKDDALRYIRFLRSSKT